MPQKEEARCRYVVRVHEPDGKERETLVLCEADDIAEVRRCVMRAVTHEFRERPSKWTYITVRTSAKVARETPTRGTTLLMLAVFDGAAWAHIYTDAATASALYAIE